ncbi:hypothetical protein ACYOEI_38570, partial [Singulisphaera rosea]
MRLVHSRKSVAIVGLAISWWLAGHTPEASAQGTSSTPEPPMVKGWTKGKGWGWIWGKDDEVGALNAMTDASRSSALALAKRGETF